MDSMIKVENLGLKRPLDKMTSKELRQLAMNRIPQVIGASSMDKEKLLKDIKAILGIEKVVSPYKTQIYGLKWQIRELRKKKSELINRKDRAILRRKINKLKKCTRRLAQAV
ncbi:conserved hypothetical protein [Desulfovibrionales bacterium]